MSQPTISIAMATYNGERYLQEQLESLARQSLLPFELQVGDDGSSDATLDILDRFARAAPFPVSIVKNKPRLGYGENFLSAARRCSGDWVAFCDQDDVWFPDKLSRCAEVIHSTDHSLRLIVHGATVTDSELRPIGSFDKGPFGSFCRFSLPPHYLANGFRQIFRRKPILDLSCGSPRRIGWAQTPESHDSWVSVIASLTGTVVSIPDSLAYYRRHEHTTTTIPPRDVIAAAQGSIRNNGQVYQAESGAFRALAKYLRASASPEAVDAAAEVESYAELLEQRSIVYLHPRRVTRLAALWRLVRSGAYDNSTGWRLSRRSAAKDLVFSLC